MNSAILDKIRKLLRLGQSSNPNEAASAIARAFELAHKYQVDLDGIDASDDEEIEHLLLRVGVRLPLERRRILNLVNTFFRVQIVICRPNVAFIGRKTDVLIAHYAHDFLLTSIRNGLAEYQRDNRRKLSKTRRVNYIQGWIYGVAQKLEGAAQAMAVEDSRYAIALVDADPRIQAVSSELYPNTFTRQIAPSARRNLSAMMTGFMDGKQVDVHQPLNGPERLALN